MTSSIPVRKTVEPVRKIITDLDQSDEAEIGAQKSKKSHRHREKKDLRKLSGNFPPSRSRSVDRVAKNSGYLEILVQTKDDQIEKLVQKVTDLHTFNDQFSVENENLRAEVLTVSNKLQAMAKTLADTENRACADCEEHKKFDQERETERESLSKTNNALKDDIAMMKTLVYRLNVQLERYQELIRQSHGEDENLDPLPRSPSNDNGTINRKWGSVNTHILAPLLSAYEEMLKEKDDLILQHDRELNRFTGHLKEMILENEKLHTEMDELRKGKDGWLEEKTRLQAQLEICRSKAELQTKRADIAKEKLVEVLRCYEQKVQAQSLDIERLQEAYSRAKGEIISLRNVNAHPESILESLKECQRLFEELKSQHNNEKLRISQDLVECRRLHSELEASTSKLREENATLRTSLELKKGLEDVLKKKNTSLRYKFRKLNDSRDGLKARLQTALQWAQKLEQSREKMKSGWNSFKELEAMVKHKDAQMRGLHARHSDEIGKLEFKLQQREETIKRILKDRTKVGVARNQD